MKMKNKQLKEDGQASAPEKLFAFASVRSVGGKSLFDEKDIVTSQNAHLFQSEEQLITQAIKKFTELGFEVLGQSKIGVSIAGPISLYEKIFKTKISSNEKRVIKESGKEDDATFWDSNNSPTPGLINTNESPLADLIEGIAIEEPIYFMSERIIGPYKTYNHLTVPDGVGVVLNAYQAHRSGFTGKGIKICMVDSGWYKHPFFLSRYYNVLTPLLGPSAVSPLTDENGHGTSESANIFAVAPEVTLQPVKINFVNSIGAFNVAVAQSPQIITCSWGSSIRNPPLSAANQALAASIASAVASGIVVVFSAGNIHYGFPGQHPDVISAGGVYREMDGTLKASNYASGFTSNIYIGRKVPDLSGLVGMLPRAAYLMLPLPANCEIDQALGNGSPHPNGDETATNDGWAAISGTSAAAPQIAGACALVLQAYPGISPARVRSFLMSTATDVTIGVGGNGSVATVGYDTATGAGLLNAGKAALLARWRRIIESIVIRPNPIPPILPERPNMFAAEHQAAYMAANNHYNDNTNLFQQIEDLILQN
ncbi:peptidase S8 [Runella sp. SP2]|nr:peptidase S8 [Runella sp. SP2]